MSQDKKDFVLACAPITPAIVESVHAFSHKKGVGMCLIASLNQVNSGVGYTGFDMHGLVDLSKELHKEYPRSSVTIARDHFGPGFGADDLKAELQADADAGVEILHVDFSKSGLPYAHQIADSMETINRAKRLGIHRFEIGTEEINPQKMMSLLEIEKNIRRFKQVCQPEFFAVNTGSFVTCGGNVNNFQKKFVKEAHSLLKIHGIKLKEHNADYLSREQIEERRGIVDAFNIAPALGHIQTVEVMKEMSDHYRTNFRRYVMEQSYVDGYYEKWFGPPDQTKNLTEVAEILGHYYYEDSERNYKSSALSEAFFREYELYHDL